MGDRQEGAEIPGQPAVELLTAETGQKDLVDFARLFVKYVRNYPLEEVEAEAENRARSLSTSEGMCELAIRDKGKIVAGATVVIDRQKKTVHLLWNAVETGYRERGLAKQLQAKVMALALEQGCTEAYAEIEVDNVPSLLNALHGGSIITKLLSLDGKFVVSKRLDEPSPIFLPEGMVERAEAPLQNTREINRLLKEGWYGVNLINGKKADEPDDWILILEKKK